MDYIRIICIFAEELQVYKMEQNNFLDLFMQQRKAAENSQEPELTLDEINEEIRAARIERRKRKKE